MPTIRVMSWNVESLGAEKAFTKTVIPQQTEIFNLLGLVIIEAGVHVAGIMEIKGGIGTRLMQGMLTVLNNRRPAHPAFVWDGRLSSRQDGGTKEETLYLWQNQAGNLELDPAGSPGPTSSIGIADLNAIEALMVNKAWTQAQGTQLLAALKDSGYLRYGKFKRSARMITTTTLRVDPNRWNAMNQPGPAPTVTFSPPPARQPPAGVAANAVLRQQIAAKLLDVDILRFTTYSDRSPYLANFLVGGKKLMISLLHAPGPGDFPGDANNVIGLSRPMARQVQAPNLLVMGDFNISQNMMTRRYPAFGRYLAAVGDYQFGKLSPQQLVPVFAPITGPPLNALDLMPGTRTSLTTNYLPDAAGPAAPLVSAYDKFFFRSSAVGATSIASANATGVNVVQMIAANQPAAVYRHVVAVSALTYFRAFRGAPFMVKQTARLIKEQASVQKEVKRFESYVNKIPLPHPPPLGSANFARYTTWMNKLNDARTSLAAANTSVANVGGMTALVNTPAQLAPTGIGTALATYRFAVSDHLPITVDLTA